MGFCHDSIVKAVAAGNRQIDEAMNTADFDPDTQSIKDWIIEDNAGPSLQRLSAIAFCIQWQVDGREADRLKVRNIIKDLPPDYRRDEKPERSSELHPCLVDKQAKP